jgi:hypothetical protein
MQTLPASAGRQQVFSLRVLDDGPLVAVAQHSGHDVRDEVAPLLAIDDAQRLREEDPFTETWTSVAPVRIVVHRSRFEVDMNRPREEAVYQRPEHAWGLSVWRASPPPSEVVRRSLDQYDAFYAEVRQTLDELARLYGRVLVLDLHSYNHRRPGPHAPPEAAAENPDINVGTETMPRGRWRRVVERFIHDLRQFDLPTGPLDVRENVKFGGGHFPEWVHENYPACGCALAVEVKKFFMDEWTGIPDRRKLRDIGRAIASTVPGLLQELGK